MDRIVYCKFSNMISEVLLRNFLTVGKSFFTKKGKMKKRLLENRIRGSIFKRSIEDYMKEIGKYRNIEKTVLVS